MNLKIKWPLKIFRINQKFGNVMPYYTSVGLKGHNGIDFYAMNSMPVFATHDGVVTFAGEEGKNGGWGIVIRTTEKFDDNYYKSIYWHLLPAGLKVTGGQKVKAGDIIALSNNSGYSSGPHLHFALKPIAKGENDWDWNNSRQNNGYFGAVDPYPFFETLPLKFTQALKLGSQGDEVKQLQSFFLNVWADGKFGPITQAALKSWQSRSGLVPDGIIGPKSR